MKRKIEDISNNLFKRRKITIFDDLKTHMKIVGDNICHLSTYNSDKYIEQTLICKLDSEILLWLNEQDTFLKTYYINRLRCIENNPCWRIIKEHLHFEVDYRHRKENARTIFLTMGDHHLVQNSLGFLLCRLGEKKEGMDNLIKSATQGNIEAQIGLAKIYLDNAKPGRHKEDDPNGIEAMKWHRKAAEQGHTDSQFFMATFLVNDEEIKWLTMAAEGGNIKGQYQLGYNLLYGCNVKKDVVKAEYWLRKSIKGKSIFNEITLTSNADTCWAKALQILYDDLKSEIQLKKCIDIPEDIVKLIVQYSST
jgi:hypothetical protein